MKLIEKTLVALCVAGILAGPAGIAWEQHLRSTQETRIVVDPETQAQAPAPSAPHCVHEVCAERPRYIRCTDNYANCNSFEIFYEHHCDCDRWEP